MRRTIINISSGAIGYVLPIGLNLFFTPLIIKTLGSEAYGIQSLVNVIIGFLMAADMGLDIPVTRAVAEYRAHNNSIMLNKLLNSTLQIYLFIGILGLLAIGLSAPLLVNNVFKVPIKLSQQAVEVFYLAGLGFIGSLFSMWGKSIFNGLLRYDISNGINLVSNVLSLLLGTMFVLQGFGVVVYVFIRVAFIFLSGLAYLLIGKAFLTNFTLSLSFHKEIWRSLKSQVGYGFLLRLSGILTSRLDQILVGIWIGIAAVGFYSIPILIIVSLGGLINSMTHYLFPKMSELFSLDKKQEIKDLFLKSSRYLGMLIACIYTPFIVFGPRFLYLWVGKEVAENTATVFILLLFATILSTLFALMINSYLVATGKLNLYTKYTLFRAILLAISLICFLRLIGLNGAGWAMIICGLLDVFFYFFVVIKYVKFNPLSLFSGIYLKLGIISLISGLIIKFFYLTHIYSWATLVIGASLYLIISLFLCFVFRVFNDEEKAMFNAVTSRLFGF